MGDVKDEAFGSVQVQRSSGIVVHKLSDGREQRWRVIEMQGADPLTPLGQGALGSNVPLPVGEAPVIVDLQPDVAVSTAGAGTSRSGAQNAAARKDTKGDSSDESSSHEAG